MKSRQSFEERSRIGGTGRERKIQHQLVDTISGSPTGSLVAMETMLDFAGRRNVSPMPGRFPMSQTNEAFARLESGQARYLNVLDAEFFEDEGGQRA